MTTDREQYAPGPAHGAQVRKDGEKWTLVLVRELRHSPTNVWQALTDPAQLRRIGERLPDLFRRVAEFSDENERPLLSVPLHLCPAGRTWCVLLASGHFLLLVFVFFFVRVD